VTKTASIAMVALLVVTLVQHACAAQNQVTPSIAVQGRFDDNIFFDSTNEKNDYILTITPAMVLDHRTERIDSALRLGFPIVRYAHHKQLDAIDQTYSGNLRYRWSPRFSTMLEAVYLVDSQPGRDVIETGLVIDETTRKRLNAGFSGEYFLSETTSVGLAYARAEENYNNSTSADNASHRLDLAITRNMEKILPNTHGRITLGAGRYEFPASTVDNYSAMAGAVRRLTELYSISADFGIRSTQSEFETLSLQWVAPGVFQLVPVKQTSDDLGTVGRAAIAYQGEFTHASLTFYRDIATSGGRAGAVERTFFVFDVAKRLSDKLWGHLSAGYYLNESQGSELARQGIDEKTWRLNPYLRYIFSNNLSLVTSYSYTNIDNRTHGTTAVRNAVFLRLAYFHPMLD
jgi:hypothetical protein